MARPVACRRPTRPQEGLAIRSPQFEGLLSDPVGGSLINELHGVAAEGGFDAGYAGDRPARLCHQDVDAVLRGNGRRCIGVDGGQIGDQQVRWDVDCGAGGKPQHRRP
jgi:hypothetical protein